MEINNYRWFIELRYDGAAFSGWQRQLNAPSVQQTLEEALSLLLQKNTTVVGCGRTDSGVHASSFFAHFDTQEALEPKKIVYKLNSYLQKNIGIISIKQTGTNLHARFDATSRTYLYFILFKKDPFRLNYAHYIYNKELEIDKMNEAANLLIGEKNFSCFEKIGSDNSTSICNVTSAKWTKTDEGMIFEIKANRFLRNMVRSIVGTLLEVGYGNISLKDLKRILESQDRSRAGASAPAKGLFLSQITYPKPKGIE